MDKYITVRLSAKTMAPFKRAMVLNNVWRSTTSTGALFYSDLGKFPLDQSYSAQELADHYKGRGFSSVRLVTIEEPNRERNVDAIGGSSYRLMSTSEGKRESQWTRTLLSKALRRLLR